MMTPAELPKVELHCHLDGIPDPAMLREVERRGIVLPVRPETLAARYPVIDFDRFLDWFRAIEPLEGDLEHFKPLLAIHLERLKAQKVVYTEIMIAGSEIPRDDAERIGKMRAFREWVDAQEAGQIQVEFLACFGRNRSPERAEEIADRVLELYEAGLIVGVALAGPERGYPVQRLQRTFARFHEARVPVEIHAGEWCGPESVWDALEYGFPRRIGHGVAAFEDPRLLTHIQELGIHLEMCPTSNLKTGSVQHLEAHPVGLARDLGLSFGINTDDPGAFECCMNSEYELLEQLFGFQEDDFARIYANSLEARFQPRLRDLAQRPGREEG